MSFDLMGELEAFVGRANQIKKLKAEQKKLENENGKIEEALIEKMAESGLTNMTIRGQGVHIREQIWASAPDVFDPVTEEYVGKDWDRAVRALEDCGFGGLEETKVNAQKLSALVRELADSEDGIPTLLEENLKISETHKLIVTGRQKA